MVVLFSMSTNVLVPSASDFVCPVECICTAKSAWNMIVPTHFSLLLSSRVWT